MKIIINPTFQNLTSFVSQLSTNFELEGETIYDERNKLKRFQVNGLDIVVKRFRKPHIINQIAYSFFRSSKAERSFNNAKKLLENGINTPKPIAYIEDKKAGLLQFSYYICVFEKEYSHIRNQMLGIDVDEFFLLKLAQFIANLHRKGILDHDLSPGNILFKRSGQEISFSLVDVNRMSFLQKISLNVRYQNFKRISEDVSIITTIAQEYAKVSGIDKQTSIQEINKYCSKFIK